MDTKHSIQQKFQVGNELYTLVYFPDKGDVTQCEPNYQLMQPVAKDVTEVFFPDGKGGNVKKFMTWLRAITPANQQTMTPQKNFLLFALLDLPTPIEHLAPASLICYAVQDTSQNGVNVQQQVVNQLLNVKEHEIAPKQQIESDWASSMFTKAPIEESVSEEEVLEDDTLDTSAN